MKLPGRPSGLTQKNLFHRRGAENTENSQRILKDSVRTLQSPRLCGEKGDSENILRKKLSAQPFNFRRRADSRRNLWLTVARSGGYTFRPKKSETQSRQ